MLMIMKQLLKSCLHTDDMKGKIIDVIEKGYKLGEKVIRYPKVVIGK